MPLALILLLLALLAPPARAMTEAEFDTYFVGGPLATSGTREGGCATVIHPRLLCTPAQLEDQIDYAQEAGTLNAVLLARARTFWANNHTPPPPYQGCGTCGDMTQTETATSIVTTLFSPDLSSDATAMAACTTGFGFLVSGRADDPLIPGTAEVLSSFECNWNTSCASTSGMRTIEGATPGLGLYSSTAFIFDLLRDDLNPKRRGAALRALSKARCASLIEDSGGGRWQWTNYKLAPLLAVYGDSADLGFNDAIRDTICSQITYWEDRIIPCMDSLDTIGYQENYYAQRHGARLFLAAMIQTCFPGYDSPILAASAIVGGGQFYRFMCRPDDLTESGAKRVAMERGPDKFNTKGWHPVATLSMHGTFFGDEDSWQMADYLGKNDYHFGPNNTSGITGSWPLLLWHNPHQHTVASLNTLQRYAWSPKWGILAARSGWSDPGSSNTDTRVHHYPLYVQGAGHRNAGHWTMSRGPWNLINDSGLYLTDLEDAYQAWLAQSTSHNTIEIFRSGNNSFSGSSTYYSVDEGAITECEDTPSDPNLDFGWQEDGNATEGLALFGGACNNLGATRAQMQKRGSNLSETIVEGECHYIASDLSLAYSGNRQESVRRAWYYDGDATVVILDQVIAGESVKMVTSALHTINAPMHQAGTIQVLRGGGSVSADSIRVDSDGTTTDTHGGIYRIRGNTLAQSASAAMRSTNGTAAVWAFPVEVRNATANRAGHMLSIGGPNKVGQHWAQSKYPCVPAPFWSGASNATAGTAFEFWQWDADSVLIGWNAAPGSHTSGPACAPPNNRAMSNATISPECGGGIGTRYRGAGTQVSQPPTTTLANNRNNYTGAGEGHGKDVGDWSTYTVVPNPAPGDLCESAVVCVATSSTASKPSVKYTHTGDIYAVAVDTGAGWRVHVVPTATFGARATLIEWANPLTSENATIRVPGLEPSTTYDLEHDGAVAQQLTSDGVGYLSWSHTADGVGSFALRKSNEPAPVPEPDPGASYTLMHDAGYHPRERNLMVAGSGTLLALYWSEGAYGTPIWAQISRDGGSSWLDLEGGQGSATEIVHDAPVFGSGYMAARADAGMSAALDPASNDLWIAYGSQRLNASHVIQAGGLRLSRFAYDSSLDSWELEPEFTHDTSENAGTANDRVGADVALLVSRGSQAFLAWRGPSGGSYAIHSRRVKASTVTSMSSGAVLASADQYPQIIEQPTGTIWLLASVQTALPEDSVRVRTATAGSSAQWGATTRAAGVIGTNGEWCASMGPSGPAWVAYDAPAGTYRLGYWSGSAWIDGGPVQGSLGPTKTHVALTRAGVERIVLTSRYTSGANGIVERAYWSLADGWSPFEIVWPATEGLAYPHVAAVSPTSLVAWAWRTAGDDGFAARSFSIPGPIEPTGACCVSTTCTITTAEACAGTWQGADTACSPNPCVSPPASGACCYPDGTCAVTTEDGCGGTYQGDGTDCDPNPCPAGPPSQSGRRRRVLLAGGQ